MKEHPILFNTPAVQAILEGHKTVTCRVVKNGRGPNDLFSIHRLESVAREPSPGLMFWGFVFWSPDCPWEDHRQCPYGVPGDLLYVRETFQPPVRIPGFPSFPAVYRADLPERDALAMFWCASIHMPKALARIWLEVTDVQAKRVKEMTASDMVAEGFEVTPSAAEAVFSAYWNSIYAKKGCSWNANCWVWVISFKRIER